MEAYLAGLPRVSMMALRKGFLDVGVADNTVLIFSRLMDGESLFLTANADTVYFLSYLDLSDGPLALRVPPDCLGTIDDMWFVWVTDFGTPGPDRGAGGSYVLLPPGYDGRVPEGGSFVARIKETLRISPYTPGGYGSSVGSFLQGKSPPAPPSAPPPPVFTEGSGLAMNTIPPNDLSFYQLLDELVQEQPATAPTPCTSPPPAPTASPKATGSGPPPARAGSRSSASTAPGNPSSTAPGAPPK